MQQNRRHLAGRARVCLSGDLHFYMRHSFVPDDAGEGMERDEREKEEGEKGKAAEKEKAEADENGGAPPPPPSTSSSSSPSFSASSSSSKLVSPPEHLIVNGLGGAFLHPTHTFAGSVFGVPSMAGATSATPW